MLDERSKFKFLGDNWQKIIVSIGLVVTVFAITLLTTKTDDLSSIENKNAENQVVKGENNLKNSSTTTTTSTTRTVSTSSLSTTTQQEMSTNPYDVAIKAESAVVWDMDNQQVLFAKNSDKEQPLASLTKLMTALVATDFASGTSSTSSQKTVISRQHLDALGDNGLVAGQSWNIFDLISFMLIESSNDAARAVAAAHSSDKSDGYAEEFVDEMNKTARSLGLESTYFFNPSGLDLNETLISGGYGSAHDIALLFDHIFHTNQSILAPTAKISYKFNSIDGSAYVAQNTNTWLSNFSNIIGSKTGYTVLAGGNLVMGFDLKRPIVIVVLGSTKNGRFQDVQTLYNATQKYFSQPRDNNDLNTL